MNEYITNNFLFFSITPKIDFHVKKMSALLQQVKGGGQGQAISKSEVAAAADNILGPLMDLLDGEMMMMMMMMMMVMVVMMIMMMRRRMRIMFDAAYVAGWRCGITCCCHCCCC